MIDVLAITQDAYSLPLPECDVAFEHGSGFKGMQMCILCI